MSAEPLRPPRGGEPPPATATLPDGQSIDLLTLAGEVCRRYRLEFPDERERYGAAGNSWCVHDNQHLLDWAVETVLGEFDMQAQVGWLAGVLAARDFPVDRLARNLEVAAEVVNLDVPGPQAQQLADVLIDAATFLRSIDFAAEGPPVV